MEMSFKEVVSKIKKGDCYACTSNAFTIKTISMDAYGSLQFKFDNDFDLAIHPKARFIKVIN